MTYVYPVVSRRAGGVSLGINLNPNNACTWQCIYCQVPKLTRGSAPTIDLKQLEIELHTMLSAIIHGEFMINHVPETSRVMRDIAISGNGEPSSCHQLSQIISIITEKLAAFNLQALPIILITNGSFMHRRYVHDALKKIKKHGGAVWFKIDRVTPKHLEQVNGIKLNSNYLKKQIYFAAQYADTWIQSCFFAIDGQAPEKEEVEKYLLFLQALRNAHIDIIGVQLYGIARPSMQPEANRLSNLSKQWMQTLAERIKVLNFNVTLNP